MCEFCGCAGRRTSGRLRHDTGATDGAIRIPVVSVALKRAAPERDVVIHEGRPLHRLAEAGGRVPDPSDDGPD